MFCVDPTNISTCFHISRVWLLRQMQWRVFYFLLLVGVIIENSPKAVRFKRFAEHLTRHSWQRDIYIFKKTRVYFKVYLYIYIYFSYIYIYIYIYMYKYILYISYIYHMNLICICTIIVEKYFNKNIFSKISYMLVM